MIVRRSFALAVGLMLAGLALVPAQRALASSKLVTASPKALEFAPNRAVTQYMVVTNTGKYPLAVTFQVTKPFDTLFAPTNLPPMRSSPLAVTLGAHDPQTPLKGTLKVLDRAGVVQASVRLSYSPQDSTRSPIGVVPETLDFGTVPAGSSAEAGVGLAYYGTGDPGRLTVIAATSPPLSFGGAESFETTMDHLPHATVTYSPERPGEDVNRTIQFMLDGKVAASVQVRGKAGPAPPADLTFDPPKVDWGSVTFGLGSAILQPQPPTQITIANTSQYAVGISIAPPRDPFSVREEPLRLLNPGEQYYAYVGYALSLSQGGLGEFTGYLVVHVQRFKKKANGGYEAVGKHHDERVKLHVKSLPTPASEALTLTGDKIRDGCPQDPPPSPPWLAYCSLPPGQFQVHSVTVTNQSRNFSYALSWDALHKSQFDIAAPPQGGLALGPGKEAKIEVKFTADAGNETETELVRAGVVDPFSGAVTLSDLGTITLLGNVNSITVSPSIIEFGTVHLSSHVDPRPFTVHNHGPTRRSLSAGFNVGYYTTAGASTFDLEPGADGSSSVELLNSVGAGDHTDSLVIMDGPGGVAYATVHVIVVEGNAPQRARRRPPR